MKRKALTLFLALCVCFSLVPAYAINESSLEITNGKFASEEMVLAQETLDSFFSSRNYTADAVAMSLSNSMETVPATEEISNDTALRTQALKDFWLNEDVEIVATSASSQVLSAKQLSRSGNVDAVVYEWTWVDYLDGDSTVIDRMGFATLHDMTLEPTNDGTYRIVRDGYDELDISGHVSADYDAEAFSLAVENIDTDAAYSNAIEENANEVTAAAAATTSMPNVFGCIKYADKWVNHEIYNDYNNHCYNPAFGAFPGNDCCNYVSQCLNAGGIQMDPNKTAAGWWYTNNGTTVNEKNSGKAWRGVDSFRKYWTQHGYSALSATTNSVLPGNPVYYVILNEQSEVTEAHIAICVGYNSAGNPIINGHTRDVYHQKWNSVYTHTIQFNTTNPFVVSPKNATTVTLGTYSGLYLQAGKGEWFKFTAPASAYYTFYTTGSTNTYGGVFQASKRSLKGDDMCLYELHSNDDGPWDGVNFRTGSNLTAGEVYYILVCAGGTNEQSVSGGFNLVVQKG